MKIAVILMLVGVMLISLIRVGNIIIKEMCDPEIQYFLDSGLSLRGYLIFSLNGSRGTWALGPSGPSRP